MTKTIIIGLIVVASCHSALADELDDMPELACARASSDLEREQIGCWDARFSVVGARRTESPRDRSEDD